MGQGIDVKREPHILFRGIENRFAAADARVVDEDCRGADLGADLGGDGRNGGGGGDVAFEVVDVWTWGEGGGGLVGFSKVDVGS